MVVERPTSRIVDLSRPGRELPVEIDVAEAAELLVSMGTLTADADLDSFELGRERLEQLRAAAPSDLLAPANGVLLGWGKWAAQLLGLVYTTPKPRTAAAFVERLAATDPVEIQLHLLGYYMRGRHVSEPETIRRAATGDEDAQKELVEAFSEWPAECSVFQDVFELGPERAKAMLVDLISRWREEVFPPLAAEAAPLAERDAAEKRRLADTLAPEQLVERMAPGLQYLPTPDVHRIVFFPVYTSRPWVYTSEYKHVKIFCYPIRVDREEAPPDDPARLVRVYKALGDESRLKLLRRLQAGPVTLAEAAQELGLAKSTTHHHLAILRQAGFVLIRDSDDLYSLREDLQPEPGALLTAYLRS
jgi:DNA-binding transcriptional ArsR family regulator